MKNVVIVGGGAGGLELATFLGDKLGKRERANVTLIDRNSTHLWKPLLHELATGALDDGVEGLSYRAHAHHHHFNFEQGTMVGLNRQHKYVELAPVYGQDGDMIVISRRIPYDYLIIAIGSKSNDFNTKGVAENCIFLDSSEQAMRFQNKMLELFLKFSENCALDEIGEEESKQQLAEENFVNIAIVGAGATGVELSAELYNAAEHLSSYGYGKIDTSHLKVTLIEAGQRILPALPERISRDAQKELEELGVNVKTNTMIIEAGEKYLQTKEGEKIPADIMVWSAGIRTSSVTQQFDGLEINRLNQLVVKKTMQTTVDDSIFAMGDCCYFMQDNGTAVPPKAQAAHQMAKFLAKNIVALFDEKPLKEFKYNDKGSLVSLSEFTAYGDLSGLFKMERASTMTIEGKLAQWMYVSLYRMHQSALHGCFKTGLIILVGRLNRFLRPSLKLH